MSGYIGIFTSDMMALIGFGHAARDIRQYSQLIILKIDMFGGTIILKQPATQNQNPDFRQKIPSARSHAYTGLCRTCG